MANQISIEPILYQSSRTKQHLLLPLMVPPDVPYVHGCAPQGVSTETAGAASGGPPAVTTWSGRTVVHRAEHVPRSDFVQQLDWEDEGPLAGTICFPLLPCCDQLTHVCKAAQASTMRGLCKVALGFHCCHVVTN